MFSFLPLPIHAHQTLRLPFSSFFAQPLSPLSPGIWHTSIVYNSREIYYGQGILESRPGTTHHGRPLQVLSMGETAIDPETFDEFIDGLRDRFTAEKYHLLEHNCNTFTAELVQFLTGAEYPAWISSELRSPSFLFAGLADSDSC
jgi:hypothetical protein